MKINIPLRIGGLLFVIACAATGVIGFTQAKYAASATGQASARVAKFHVVVNNTDISQEAGATISVTAKLIADEGLMQPADASGNTRQQWAVTDVHPNTILYTNGSLIAPGTGGRVEFIFENRSEVSVRFYLDSITSSVTTTGGLTYAQSAGASACEIQFCRVTGNAYEATPAGTAGTWGDLVTALSTTNTLDLAPMKTLSASIDRRSVLWRWQFQNGTASPYRDAIDTVLGLAGTATLTLKITVRAEQID